MKLEDLKEGTLYVISDTFFRKVKDPYLMKNHPNGFRPSCFVFCDDVDNIPWVIPLSTRAGKYDYITVTIKNEINSATSISKKEELEKKLLGLKKVFVRGHNCYILFQDMFPIHEKYIRRPYMYDGKPYSFDKEITEDIINQARIVKELLESGFIFVKTQPDIEKIKKMMMLQSKN